MKKFGIIILINTVLSICSFGQENSLHKIIPDDYPLSNEMLSEINEGDGTRKKKSNDIFSLDKAWFTNDTLRQTLVFELYTDYHRLVTYHFNNDDIPDELIKRMELYISKNKFDNVFGPANYQQKKTHINGFINASQEISRNYFTTIKGIKLGDKKNIVVNIYGKPHSTSLSDGLEQYEWKFDGDYDEHIPAKDKKTAKDSFGYGVTMFFRSNELTAIILFNDIP